MSHPISSIHTQNPIQDVTTIPNRQGSTDLQESPTEKIHEAAINTFSQQKNPPPPLLRKPNFTLQTQQQLTNPQTEH
jgi:hypothetical protein